MRVRVSVCAQVCPQETTPAGLAGLTSLGLLHSLERLALYDAELPCESLAQHLAAASRLSSLQFGLSSIEPELGTLHSLPKLQVWFWKPAGEEGGWRLLSGQQLSAKTLAVEGVEPASKPASDSGCSARGAWAVFFAALLLCVPESVSTTVCVLYCCVLQEIGLDTAFLPSLQELVSTARLGKIPAQGPGSITSLCLLDQTVSSSQQLACLSQLSSLAGRPVVACFDIQGFFGSGFIEFV